MKHRKLSNIALAATVALATAATAFIADGRDSDWDAEARQRKIDYLFMEGLSQSNADHMTRAFDLLRRAYSLDTTATDIGAELALYYLPLADNPELEAKAIKMIADRYEADPSDLNNSVFHATITEQKGSQTEAIKIWQTIDSLNPQRMEVKWSYIDAMFKAGDSTLYPEIYRQLDKLTTVIGPDAKFTTRAVLVDIARKDTIAAADRIRRLIAEAPLNVDNYIMAGQFFSSINQPDSAIKYLDKACAVDSTSGDAFYARADYYRHKGDSAAFNRETTHALLNTDLDNEEKAEILYNYVKGVYRDSTQTERIDTLFSQVIAKNPHVYAFHQLYADYLSSGQRYTEAADQADMSLDIDPSDPDQWRKSIVYHFVAKDTPGAVEAANKAVKYHSDVYQLAILRANMLQADKRYDQALDAYNDILADSVLNPDREQRSDIMVSISNIYSQLEMNDSSNLYLERALALQPDNILAANNLAYHLAVSGGDLDRAEKLSLMTITAEPQNPTYLDTYAWVLFKRRDYPKALQYIERALEASDFNTEIFNDIDANDEVEDFVIDAAQESAKTFDKDDSEFSAEIYDHAGDIYFWNQMPAKALKMWMMALIFDPNNELIARKVKYKTYFAE